MNDLNDPSMQPLDYHPRPRNSNAFFLILSIMFAIGVAFLCFVAFMFLLGAGPVWAAALATGIGVFTIGAIAARRRLGAATAIAVAALCAFLLMVGICSAGPTFYLEGPTRAATVPAVPAK